MMIYRLSDAYNNFGVVEYDHQASVDYTLFLEDFSLAGLQGDLLYKIKKKNDVKRMAKFHLLQSTGPTLVSDAFREVLEFVAPGEAEFFDVRVSYHDEIVQGYSAINLLHTLPCADMSVSEYTLTNFDVNDPHYDFTYMVMKADFDEPVHVAACKEQRRSIVVAESIRAAFGAAGLSGIRFCRAIDMSYNNRTDCC